MKLAIFLIVVGTGISIDGLIRIALGLAAGNYLLVIGGIITGILIGGIMVVKGIKRLQRIRGDQPS